MPWVLPSVIKQGFYKYIFVNKGIRNGSAYQKYDNICGYSLPMLYKYNYRISS